MLFNFLQYVLSYCRSLSLYMMGCVPFYNYLISSTVFSVGTYIKGNCKVLVDVKTRISIRLHLKKSSAAGV